MRRAFSTLAVCLVLAGCGDDTPEPPPRPVQLTLSAPADAATVQGERVTVRGRVSPAESEVRVLGEPVDVTGGAFAIAVALEEGSNIIDVSASAAGRRPASTAVRVVREMPVVIPDLVGEDAAAAIEELEGLALVVERREGGGLLDDLLPRDERVCSLDPGPGTKVRPRSTVTVETARAC